MVEAISQRIAVAEARTNAVCIRWCQCLVVVVTVCEYINFNLCMRRCGTRRSVTVTELTMTAVQRCYSCCVQ